MKILLNFTKSNSTILLILLIITFFSSCSSFKPGDARNTPVNAQERARKNVTEGKGISIGNAIKGSRETNYEFSSSNPIWRASLEILDFLPLTTVDYSGGVIITDWYSDKNSNNVALKLTIRFLSNEIQSNSIKIVVHQRTCQSFNNCSINEINSKIKEELVKSILSKAAIFEKEKKKK